MSCTETDMPPPPGAIFPFPSGKTSGCLPSLRTPRQSTTSQICGTPLSLRMLLYKLGISARRLALGIYLGNVDTKKCVPQKCGDKIPTVLRFTMKSPFN